MSALVALWLFLLPAREDSTWIADALGTEAEDDTDTPSLTAPDGTEYGPSYAGNSSPNL